MHLKKLLKTHKLIAANLIEKFIKDRNEKRLKLKEVMQQWKEGMVIFPSAYSKALIKEEYAAFHVDLAG
jgi:hypothetical protein